MKMDPKTNMSEPFDIFLSHNSKDKPIVRRLADKLRELGFRVWLDEQQLIPGRLFQVELEKIIETTRAAAVLIGKDGLGPWEAPEMYACLSQFVSRGLPVIPVLLPDAPDKPKLPLLLKELNWVDLRKKKLTKKALDQLTRGINSPEPKAIENGVKKIRNMMGDFIPGFDTKFPENASEKLISTIREEKLFLINTARAIVFGRTHVGKTTIINHLLNNPIFPTAGHLTCTLSIACGEHEGGLIFFDSPGIGDVRYQQNITRIILGMEQLIKNEMKDKVNEINRYDY